MIVFNHNTMSNAVFSNNNMANFYNNFVKTFDTTSGSHKAELCIEPFNCKGNCNNAFNGMTFSSGDSHSDIHIDTLDLSAVTWAQNMYRHTSGYDGANIYINTLILNLDNIKPTSGTSSYAIDNMFNGMKSMYINEVKLLGNLYNSKYYNNSTNAFNGVHIDHFYTGTEFNERASRFRQNIGRDAKDWRYCVSDMVVPVTWGAPTFYCRDYDVHPIPLETHRMGVGYIINNFGPNNQAIIDVVSDSSTSPTTFTFSKKLYSVHNTNIFCTKDLWKYSITTAQFAPDNFKNSKGGFFNVCPACIFDDFNDWNSPEGVKIRETAIPTSITTLDNAYNAVIRTTSTYKIPVGYCGLDFAPICGAAVTTMQNAYRNCRGIFSMSAVCGSNVTNMRYAYADCSNLKTAACGPNVKDMSYAYRGCTNLASPVCGANVKDMSYAYCQSNALYGICGDNVIYMNNAFDQCKYLVLPYVCNNVENMGYAFPSYDFDGMYRSETSRYQWFIIPPKVTSIDKIWPGGLSSSALFIPDNSVRRAYFLWNTPETLKSAASSFGSQFTRSSVRFAGTSHKSGNLKDIYLNVNAHDIPEDDFDPAVKRVLNMFNIDKTETCTPINIHFNCDIERYPWVSDTYNHIYIDGWDGVIDYSYDWNQYPVEPPTDVPY